MKRIGRIASLSIIGVMALFIGNGVTDLKAQDNSGQSSGAAENQDGLIIDWMNDFEACEDWRAVSTCPLGDTKIRKIPGKPRPINTEGKAVNEKGEEGEFSDTVTDENGFTHENKSVLGVKTYFYDRGFDRVEVFPPNEYIVRGKAKEIKVWCLGRKFRHTLFVKLRDYRGDIHKLKVGRLDFWGWKEMSVIIPGWLPQSSTFAMLDKNLHFVSFYIESDRFEVPGTFYCYFDQFRIITDLSEFTGDETIRDNW